MRFDRLIKLIALVPVSDGLGGRTDTEKVILEKFANVEEVSLETTFKIYGEAITENIRVVVLGKVPKVDKIEIDNIKYKIVSRKKINNKTSFFLEVDND